MAIPVPTYELYGEKASGLVPDILHCESIALRSRAHAGRIKPHRHQGLYQIMFARSGQVSAAVESRSFELDGSFLVLIPAMAVHGFRISAATDGWVLTFPEQGMQPAFAAVHGLRQVFATPGVLSADEARQDFDLLLRQMEVISSEFGSAYAGRQYVLQTELNSFLIRLGRSVASTDLGTVNIQNRKAIKVGKLLRRIESGFREHLPASAYARDLGMTATHLNRICREVLNRSTSELIHERVVMEAKRNLVYTAMTITEIARVLGFTDTSYFSRFFCRKAGTTPLKYRRQQQQAMTQRPGDAKVRAAGSRAKRAYQEA